MPPDPLASLARLRRQGVDEARQILVNCLDTEEDSGRRAAMAEASIAQELQVVSLLSASDNAVEGFGVWLRQATAAATAVGSFDEELQQACKAVRLASVLCQVTVPHWLV